MSFDLELEVPVATWQEAEHVAAATAAPDHLPLTVNARTTRWLRRPLPPGVHTDPYEGQALLDDQADWDERCFTLEPRQAERLARTVLTLGVIRPTGGWWLRASWGGDPLERAVEVTPEELAELVRRSRLERETRYVAG